MEISYFDLIAASVILLLGLKGIINGFFKEVFGLIGIIGGIFIASRTGDYLGEFLNSLIFNFSSPSAVSFVGFLLTLGIFWLLMIFVGFLFKRLSNLSGLGPVDKIFGFIFGAGKFFLIAAVIAHAFYSVKAIHTAIDSKLETSVLFPILVETGAVIMKIDPLEISEDINASIEQGTQKMQDKTQELIENSAQKEIQNIKNKIEEK
jgi:membrane protein required for colicin V production